MKKKKILEKTERALDVSTGLLQNLPNITVFGTSAIEIDNFKGLLDFTQSSVRINTTDSILRIDGIGLSIAFMTDETVCIKGTIKEIHFE